MKEAEHQFYLSGDEKENWFKETILRCLANHAELPDYVSPDSFTDFDSKYSNDIVFDFLIKKAIIKLNDSDIKNELNTIWVGLWDSTEIVNAKSIPRFYDKSQLCQVSTELAVWFRKITEVYASIILLELLHDYPECKDVAGEIYIKANEILVNDEDKSSDIVYLFALLQQLPINIRNSYETIMRSSYIGSVGFVMFHEIGHRLLKHNLGVEYFSINDVEAMFENEINSHDSEYHSDEIAYKIMNEIFEDDDCKFEICSGCIIGLVALAASNHNPRKTTPTHPPIADRYNKVIQLMKKDNNIRYVTVFLSRINFLCSLLEKRGLWNDEGWWMQIND